MTKILRRASWLVMLAGLPGCSQWSWDSIPGISILKPYSLNFQQGTVIDSEMVARLKEGMTRSQVAFVLGTPLLQDPFHKNRWDYVYYERDNGKLTKTHKLSVFFKDDKLVRYETDYAEEKPVAGAPEAAASVVATPGGKAPSDGGQGPSLDAGAAPAAAPGKGGVLDDGKVVP